MKSIYYEIIYTLIGFWGAYYALFVFNINNLARWPMIPLLACFALMLGVVGIFELFNRVHNSIYGVKK